MSAVDKGARGAIALSAAAIAVLYLAMVILADGPLVWRHLSGLSFGTAGLLLALPTLGFLVRFLRWDAFIVDLGHRIPKVLHGRIYFAGFALTTTPGKVGENLRSVYLRQHGVAPVDAFGAFVAERLGDLVAMLLLAGLAVGLADEYAGAVAVTTGATIAGLVVLRSPGVARRLEATSGPGRIARGMRGAGQALKAARRLLRPRWLVGGVGLALVAWGAEAFAFAVAARAMGIDIAVLGAMGAFAVATLLGAVSFLPGGVGPTEAVLGSVLLVQGGSLAEATAATVLVRAVTLWWAVIIGVVALGSLGGRNGVGDAMPGRSG